MESFLCRCRWPLHVALDAKVWGQRSEQGQAKNIFRSCWKEVRRFLRPEYFITCDQSSSAARHHIRFFPLNGVSVSFVLSRAHVSLLIIPFTAIGDKTGVGIAPQASWPLRAFKVLWHEIFTCNHTEDFWAVSQTMFFGICWSLTHSNTSLASRPAHYTVLHDDNTDQGPEWYVQRVIVRYSSAGLICGSLSGYKNYLSRCATVTLAQLDPFRSQHLSIVSPSPSVSSVCYRSRAHKLCV